MFSEVFLASVVIILVVQDGECETHRHTFTANTNFDNPDRWNDADHGKPCSGDTIEFPSDKVISVFVQTDATISELILPMNGEFVFDDGVIWGVSEELSSCSDDGHSHAVHFNSDADDWNKASNWEARDSSGSLLGSQDLLDIEKVPCLYDDSEFPAMNSYTADISMDVQLKSLKVSGKNFDSPGFANYRNDEGKYSFVGNGLVTIDGNGCQDASGCLCRDSGSIEDAMSMICSFVQCLTPQCENPILPLGSCCRTCGSVLTFNYTSAYKEQKMREFVNSYLSKPEYVGTHAVISKGIAEMMKQDDENTPAFTDTAYLPETLADGHPAIQILITDEGTGSKSGSVADQLALELYNQLSSPDNNLGVASIQKQSSGPGISTGMHAGTIALIVVASLFGFVILLGIALYFIRSAPLRGKKYNLTYELNDTEINTMDQFPTVSEVGPGKEFESTDDDPNMPKTAVYAENIGWPHRSAVNSDFGLSFGNPAYDGDNL